MTTLELRKITPEHRRRLAVVYVRLAAAPVTDQEHANLESQRAQRGHAYRWGWSRNAVLIIDEDTGRNGFGVGARPGLQRLCGLIAAGQVGLLVVGDLARLSRSWRDLVTVLTLCQMADTLVAVDGRLVELSTLFLRFSSPMQIRGYAASTRSQRTLGEMYRCVTEGPICAEMANTCNHPACMTLPTDDC